MNPLLLYNKFVLFCSLYVSLSHTVRLLSNKRRKIERNLPSQVFMMAGGGVIMVLWFLKLPFA